MDQPRIQSIPDLAKVQILALYSFPTVESIAASLILSALHRSADYIEVDLRCSALIALEVRDNGRGDTPEVIKGREDISLLASIGDVTVVAKHNTRTPAYILSLNSGDVRETGRLRKPGEVVGVSGIYHSLTPRETEYLSRDDHRSELVLTAIRCVLPHPDVHLAVKLAGETVLTFPKHATLQLRVAAALGNSEYHSVSFKKTMIEVRGVIAGVNAMRETQSQFLYVDCIPVDSQPIHGLLNSHFQSGIVGKSKKTDRFHPIYVLSIHLAEAPVLRRDGNWHYFEANSLIIGELDEWIHEFMREEMGISVNCERNRCLKRKQPALLTAFKQYNLHAELTDSELIRAIEAGNEFEQPKRAKISKNRLISTTDSRMSSLIDDICKETSMISNSFRLPASLKSFAKFRPGKYPSLLRHSQTRLSFSTSDFSHVKYVGQFDSKCLISTLVRDGYQFIVAVDQHAAHERVNLEQLRKELWGNIGSAGVCSDLNMSRTDRENVLKVEKSLTKWGFEYQMPTADTLKVTKTPTICGSQLPPTAIFPFADDLRLSVTPTLVNQYPSLRILCSKACKLAVKFGDSLMPEFAESLLCNLSTCKLGLMCAHGRPTVQILCAIPVSASVN